MIRDSDREAFSDGDNVELTMVERLVSRHFKWPSNNKNTVSQSFRQQSKNINSLVSSYILGDAINVYLIAIGIKIRIKIT